MDQIDEFVEACRTQDISKLEALTTEGFPAYLYVSQICRLIFEDRDRLCGWLERYLKRHPLNQILEGGLYRHLKSWRTQYEIYVAIRDNEPLDRIYDLFSRWDHEIHSECALSVAIACKFLQMEIPTLVVDVFRRFKLAHDIDTALSVAEHIDDFGEGYVEHARTRAVDDLIWSFVRGPESTGHTEQKAIWDTVHPLEHGFRTRILRLMISRLPRGSREWGCGPHLLRSLAGAGYRDLYDEARDLLGVEPGVAVVRDLTLEQRIHERENDILYVSTIREASVLVESLADLLTVDVKLARLSVRRDWHHILMYHLCVTGRRDMVRDVVSVDGHTPEDGAYPHKDYLRLTWALDEQERRLRTEVLSSEVLNRNVLGLVHMYSQSNRFIGWIGARGRECWSGSYGRCRCRRRGTRRRTPRW